MNQGAKHATANPVGRRLTRWLLVGAAVLAVVVAATFGIVERDSLPGLSLALAPRRGDDLHLVPSTAPDQSQGPFGFAFLNTRRALPDLRFVDDAGQPRALAEFRGRSIVLNIWATWCIPCRKEMPTLDHLQAMLAGSDAFVMPLSVDRQGLSAVRDFYKEIGIRSLGVYVDPSGDTSSLLGIPGIPTTLLVDRDGREIGRKIGPLAWDDPEIVALIRSHLNARPPKDEQRASP